MPNVLRVRDEVLEALACGAREEAVRARLLTTLAPEEAQRILTEARRRVANERGQPTFERALFNIRKRRVVGRRYLPWKAAAWGLLFLGGQFLATGSFMWGVAGLSAGVAIGAAVAMHEMMIAAAAGPCPADTGEGV